MFISRKQTSSQGACAGGHPVEVCVRARQNTGERQGFSLLLVMVAISTSLVLTYSFLRTQMTLARISDNSARRDLALQAAQAGAADGLANLQSPTWQGIGQTVTGVLVADRAGTASYSVVYQTLSAAGVTSLPTDEPLYLVIRSTGLWQSAVNSRETVQRQIDVTVRLAPRLPGRILHAGDLPTATDVTPNPGDYDRIQTYALFAFKGGGLTLNPQGRIDGNVWMQKDMKPPYKGPKWNGTVRTEMLTSIGMQYGSASGTTGIIPPHPLAGTVTFQTNPSGSVSADLGLLKTAWLQDSSVVTSPPVDPLSWQTYQLYAGGPVYSATPVSATLSNVTLGPTLKNPLGIFYRQGDVWISNNVIVQGTLVSNGRVTFSGNDIRIAGYNWLDNQGEGLVRHADLWPRLPAVVADSITVSQNVRVVIEGAVVTRWKVTADVGDFELMTGTDVFLTGTATSRPLHQPFSSVQLQGTPNLNSVSGTGIHSIWLQDGSSGNWYPIVGVDRIGHSLTVVGEVRHNAATAYRMGRTRLRSVDLRGPVFGEKLDIMSPPAWKVPTDVQWNQLHSDWQLQNTQATSTGKAPLSFVDWLANPKNFVGWAAPLSVSGLSLKPTFHLRNTTGITYRWSPPLFTPFSGTGLNTPYAGYRWQVLSWRELR